MTGANGAGADPPGDAGWRSIARRASRARGHRTGARQEGPASKALADARPADARLADAHGIGLARAHGSPDDAPAPHPGPRMPVGLPRAREGSAVRPGSTPGVALC